MSSLEESKGSPAIVGDSWLVRQKAALSWFYINTIACGVVDEAKAKLSGTKEPLKLSHADAERFIHACIEITKTDFRGCFGDSLGTVQANLSDITSISTAHELVEKAKSLGIRRFEVAIGKISREEPQADVLRPEEKPPIPDPVSGSGSGSAGASSLVTSTEPRQLSFPLTTIQTVMGRLQETDPDLQFVLIRQGVMKQGWFTVIPLSSVPYAVGKGNAIEDGIAGRKITPLDPKNIDKKFVYTAKALTSLSTFPTCYVMAKVDPEMCFDLSNDIETLRKKVSAQAVEANKAELDQFNAITRSPVTTTESFCVNVKALNGSQYSIDVSPEEKVVAILARISHQCEWSDSQKLGAKLMLSGSQLARDLKISDTSLTAETTILLVVPKLVTPVVAAGAGGFIPTVSIETSEGRGPARSEDPSGTLSG